MNKATSRQLAPTIRQVTAAIELVHAGVHDRVGGIPLTPFLVAFCIKTRAWFVLFNATKRK